MAAENDDGVADGRLHARASMRPRRMAAENEAPDPPPDRAPPASMRPRRMAAENPCRLRTFAAARCGFNEAAAHGRGKLGVDDGHH